MEVQRLERRAGDRLEVLSSRRFLPLFDNIRAKAIVTSWDEDPEFVEKLLGEFRDRSYEDQMNRSSGLNFLSAAIALWNAVYLGRVVETLKAMGEDIPNEYLAHLSPLEWEHITLTGVYR